MGEGTHDRLVAWAAEMTRVHARLREALDLAHEAAASGSPYDDSAHDLLLHCWGFCLALDGHHRAEDEVLFPAVVAGHPELADVVEQLRRDHRMIDHLLGGYRAALDRRDEPAALTRHLDGVGAVMESHFGHEERRLLGVLDRLDLAVDPPDALGPLA